MQANELCIRSKLSVESLHATRNNRCVSPDRAIEAKSYSSKCPSLCYILKRKIICGHCGHKAHIKTARSGKKTPARSYQCHHAEYNPHCKVRLYVPADHIEKRVVEIIKEYVLCDENISDIRRNVDSVENHDPVEKMIETLNQNISQAGQNLALAQSRTEYNLISKSISEWEQQRDKLVKKRSSQIPEKAALTIDEVMHLRENIDKADPNAMAAVVDQVIDEIVLFQERLKPNVFFINGILRFKEGVSDRCPEIKLTDEDICYQTAWKLLRKLFIEEKRALTRKEISQSLGVNADLAICSMRKLNMVECKRINNVMHYSLKS